MSNTVNIGLFLDSRRELVKKGAGVFGVKVDLRYMGRRWQFATPFTMTQAEWDNLENRKIRSDALKEKKLQLEEYKVKAQNIIDSLHPFNFSRFKELLSGKGAFSKPENRDVYRLFDERIAETMNPRTATAYQSAKRALQKYSPKLYLEDVVPLFLQRFETYMENTGHTRTSVGIYLRALRSILNQAIEDGLMRREDYPFGRRKYRIPAPAQAKIALSPEHIKHILDYEPQSMEEQQAKDIWVFSYFCGGMNINDICRLRRENVENDRIVFYRHKTRNTTGRNSLPVCNLLQPEVRMIINRLNVGEGYLFPVLQIGMPPQRQAQVIQQFTKTTNKYLKRIGQKLGIPRLTTQTARHSFATTLMNHGAPLAFISKSMGHSTTKTTEIYLGSFSMNEAAQYGAMLKAL
ncbi:site-specific integrase [uncultured Alistipes sp.]|uniref:tyrosine-type recombinase/integrase n=1 Tax=uncultured Alistipes sp. TaxID=538949 RepID=UPI00272D08DD|nr:site-specific integrase [uncultured Alistipes sp.]